MTKKISEFCRSRKFYHHVTRRTVMFLSWASTACFTRSRHTHAHTRARARASTYAHTCTHTHITHTHTHARAHTRTHTHTHHTYTQYILVYKYKCILILFPYPSVPLVSAFLHAFPYRGADKSLARPGRKQPRKHVRDARDFNNMETRAVINFSFMQGKAPKEIHPTLTETLACFLPGRAKDLSALRYFINKFMKVIVVGIY